MKMRELLDFMYVTPLLVNNNKTKVVHFVYTPDIMPRASLHTRYRNNYIGKLICVCNKSRPDPIAHPEHFIKQMNY